MKKTTPFFLLQLSFVLHKKNLKSVLQKISKEINAEYA
jgi:hypothetical protein